MIKYKYEIIKTNVDAERFCDPKTPAGPEA